MDFKGRSPFKDVTRSVVIGAAMVPAAALAGCARHNTPVNPPPGGSGGDTSVQATVAADAAAPPVEVVRPRTPPGNPNTMPTRGFAGAVRVRG